MKDTEGDNGRGCFCPFDLRDANDAPDTPPGAWGGALLDNREREIYND